MNFFSYGILVIKKDANKLENEFLNTFQATDGISDSIRTCLLNYKDKIYKGMLDDIIKPEFIREDEDFQNLLQYLIIMNSEF